MASLRAALLLAALTVVFPARVAAQEEPPPSPSPLPPPPPPPLQPGSSPPTPVAQQPPAAVVNVQAPVEEEERAPKYALWTGIRASAVAFGFGFYENERGDPETTGNYLRNGIAPQIDVGARLGYRYVPYVYWEHGFMGQGRRFEGTDATTTTEFYGIGFRYIGGDVDSVAFLTDLSIGQRVIRVSNGTQTYKMSGLELFRLGLGAEFRVKSLFALSPLLSISSGALNDTDGTIDFNCVSRGGCGDGPSRPTYTNGRAIDQGKAYVVLSLGLGIHFDLFAKKANRP